MRSYFQKTDAGFLLLSSINSEDTKAYPGKLLGRRTFKQRPIILMQARVPVQREIIVSTPIIFLELFLRTSGGLHGTCE
jgi:hypothetical protein